MSRIIVLQFDDNEGAKLFFNHHNDVPSEGVVIGEYYFPPEGVQCKCPENRKLMGGNWRPHTKFGLSVCRTCRKPSKYWRIGLFKRLTMALGTNLQGE